MDEPRSSRRRTWVKRAAGVAMVAGIGVGVSACFLPNTGILRVEVLEPLGTRPDKPFDFDRDSYRVPRGEIDVTYFGPEGSAIPHTLKVRDSDAMDLFIGPANRSDKSTVVLEPGTYELYCDIGPHASLGMTAELVVV